ncbi:anaerobic sulfatase maturase [Paenibacillus tengchongensis]|uniref:anaerobic sulfatase maturase n=1 Tax=Paenibacillus tengchongensis TaxID=2608684 RepID=UPI001FEA3B69|nr:anaerobic sulfatase maturase [Paenibacillus tengchongensis]
MNNNLSIMWKTVAEDCNLACDYCYYSGCAGRPGPKINRIDSALLQRLISQYMKQTNGTATFAWQGGEPLLAGLDFFREVVYLQAKYAKPNTAIGNSLQTNGTLITEEWARFFQEYCFFIGVSLDGPAPIHDARRTYANGTGSFKRVMAGIGQLRRHRVEFNILTVVHAGNVDRAKEMISFFREEQLNYLQFIPAMDFRAQDPGKPAQFLITAEQYGQFLCDVFDIWFNDGQPLFSERFFDHLLQAYLGGGGGICTHMSACPQTLILEQNGDAYPCDFHIHDDYKLGNAGTDSLEALLSHPNYDRFLRMKPALPDSCRTCEFLDLCHGGCPRNRGPQDGQAGVYPDYFCASYKKIYAYSRARMEQLASKVRKEWL